MLEDGEEPSPARWSKARGVLLLAAALTASCSGLGYYAQALWGGAGILARKRPIERVLADRGTSPELARKLSAALEIRRFATDELALPDNGSYRSYARLPRPYAVWNVVAAEEFSVDPVEWCFPVAGCVTYRGYFSERRARRFAERRRRRGLDVDVGGAVAYSTLGWFRDPVLSTFVDSEERDLAALVFHELAHQKLYVRGDTTFNESFAAVVEEEGVRRWLASGGRTDEIDIYLEGKRRERELAELMLECRERLRALYAGSEPPELMRRRKAELLEALQADYERLRQGWGGDDRFDGWFGPGLNNARLASFGAYHDRVPELRELLAEAGGDLPRFYEAVEALSRQERAARRSRE